MAFDSRRIRSWIQRAARGLSLLSALVFTSTNGFRLQKCAAGSGCGQVEIVAANSSAPCGVCEKRAIASPAGEGTGTTTPTLRGNGCGCSIVVLSNASVARSAPTDEAPPPPVAILPNVTAAIFENLADRTDFRARSRRAQSIELRTAPRARTEVHIV